MISNIIVKVSLEELDRVRSGAKKSVVLPRNPHWKRKLINPKSNNYYSRLRVIVRSFGKEPPFVISALAGQITGDEKSFTIELKENVVLLPPFNHQLINEPRRNSIR